MVLGNIEPFQEIHRNYRKRQFAQFTGEFIHWN